MNNTAPHRPDLSELCAAFLSAISGDAVYVYDIIYM